MNTLRPHAAAKQTTDDIKFHIHFIGIAAADEIRTAIQKRVERLLRIAPHILKCEIDVSSPHRHRTSERTYRVLIRVALPGSGVKVSHVHPSREHHRDVYVTLHDSFDAMEHILARKRPRLHHGIRRESRLADSGKITKLLKNQGIGFIESESGREFLFEDSAVRNDTFNHLAIGQEVTFEKERTGKGDRVVLVGSI